MTFGSEIAVLEGLGEDGRIGQSRAKWDQYSKVVGYNTLFRKNVIDPSMGANYSGGSSWTGGIPLTPSNAGLAGEQDRLEAVFAAFEGDDGRISQQRARPDQYARQVGYDTLFRKNVIDPSEGGNYSGGSSWTGHLPLTPSNAGLAAIGAGFADDDPYPEMTAYMNADGSGTLPTRRNVVVPGGGGLWDGGSNYTPGMPFMASSQGLAAYPNDYMAAYPNDYLAGLAAVAQTQAGKAGKIDDADRHFAVRLSSFMHRFWKRGGNKQQSKQHVLDLMGRLREKLSRSSDEGIKQRIMRRLALLTNVHAKMDNPNIKAVKISPDDRPVAHMRDGSTKPLEGCIRPFDRADAGRGVRPASALGFAPRTLVLGDFAEFEGWWKRFKHKLKKAITAPTKWLHKHVHEKLRKWEKKLQKIVITVFPPAAPFIVIHEKITGPLTEKVLDKAGLIHSTRKHISLTDVKQAIPAAAAAYAGSKAGERLNVQIPEGAKNVVSKASEAKDLVKKAQQKAKELKKLENQVKAKTNSVPVPAAKALIAAKAKAAGKHLKPPALPKALTKVDPIAKAKAELAKMKDRTVLIQKAATAAKQLKPATITHLHLKTPAKAKPVVQTAAELLVAAQGRF